LISLFWYSGSRRFSRVGVFANSSVRSSGHDNPCDTLHIKEKLNLQSLPELMRYAVRWAATEEMI
jgi:hypothetical protein